MPVITLTLAGTGEIMLLTRAALRDVMREPFLLTAAGKGLSSLSVLFRHAMAAACLPLIQGGFVIVCTAVVACNLMADLAYGLLDPRVRRQAT